MECLRLDAPPQQLLHGHEIRLSDTRVTITVETTNERICLEQDEAQEKDTDDKCACSL